MILSDNVFGDLRSLAGTIATADAPAIVELELLASLATEAASCLRRAAAENRETLRRRIETALAAFPEIAARDYARGEEAVAGLERAAATALRERANLEAAMNAGKAAFAAQEIAAAMTSLERARDAQTAIRDAEEAVRRWLAETCLVLPPATTPSVSDAPPGPAALPEAPGAELRDTVVAIPEAPTGTPVPDEPLSASTALNEPPAVEPAAVPETTVAEAIWSAFRSGRLGLAEALLEVATPDPGTVVLSAAVALAAMALVAQGDGELDDLAREATVRALDAWQSGGAESTVSKAAFALLVSASATLALLAPGSDQRTLLAVLSDAEPRPGLQLARTVAAVPVLASAREVMAALVSEEEWEAEVERVTAGLRAWHEAQLSRQIRYAAATDVWQRLLRPEDAFGAVLRTVKDGGASRVGEVQRFLDRVDPEVLIRDTEAVVPGRHAVRRKVLGDVGRRCSRCRDGLADAPAPVRCAGGSVARPEREPARRAAGAGPVADPGNPFRRRLAA